MLKFLRTKERAKKTILWLIIAVMVFAFMLWGAEAYRQKTGPDYAGVIFGRKVSIPQYRRMYISCLNDALMRFGEDYRRLLPYLNLNSQAWMKLILLHQAQKRKISTTNTEVIQAITTNPLFFRDGKFNQDTYEKTIRYYFNSSPREFEEETRNNLIIKKLYETLTKDITVNDEELLNAYKQEFENLSINYLQLKHKDFTAEVTPTEDELKAYYQKKATQFKMPPSVKVEYIGIEYPAEAKEEERMKIFDEIKILYPKIRNTKNLKGIAQGNIIYRQTGFFSFYEPVENIESFEFNKWAFRLKEKQTSPILKTQKGVYIMRLIQKKDSYIPDFHELREKVSESLKIDKAKEEARIKIKGHKDKIDAYIKNHPKANLKEAASSLGLEVKTSPEFTRRELLTEGELTPDIQNAAFSLKAGRISDVLENDSAFFLIEQDKFTPIDEKRFEKEREEYGKGLLEKKKENTFNVILQEFTLKADLKDYSSLLNLPQ
jgi:peptidyl-prolyl cis-trans isomerase D